MRRLGSGILYILGVCLTLLAEQALAQNFPTHELHILSGYAAGSSGDGFARLMAEKLRPLVGKPVLVENKPGALTAIAAEAVTKAPPDGHTIMITAGNSTMAANPYLIKDLKYDPLRDFAPIASLMQSVFIVVVAPNSPINTISDLTAYLKEKGDKATYGYSNSFALAATELYQSMAGTKAVRVGYKVMADLLPDLLNGHLDFVFADGAFGVAQAAAGRLKALAVTSRERSKIAPQLPSLHESGVTNYDLFAWWGAWAPARTPQPIVDKLSEWMVKIVSSEELTAELLKQGGETHPGDAAFLYDLTVRELRRWGEVIKLTGVEAQ